MRSGTEGRYLREEKQTAEVEGKSLPSAPDHEGMFDSPIATAVPAFSW